MNHFLSRGYLKTLEIRAIGYVHYNCLTEYGCNDEALVRKYALSDGDCRDTIQVLNSAPNFYI